MKKISCLVLMGFLLFVSLGCVKDTTTTTTVTTTTTSNNTPTTSTTITSEDVMEVSLSLTVMTSPNLLLEDEFLSYINFDLVCSGDCIVSGNYDLTSAGNKEVRVLCAEIEYVLDIQIIDSPFLSVTLSEAIYPVDSTADDIEENVLITNMAFRDFDVVFDSGNIDFTTPGEYTIYVKIFVEDEIYNVYAFPIFIQDGAVPTIQGVHNYYFPLNASFVDYLDEITFSDSDGTVVDSGYSTNVNFEESGLYSLTYFATDDLGNTTYEYANIVVGNYVAEYFFNFEELLSPEQLVTLNEYRNLLRLVSPYDFSAQNHLSYNEKIINLNQFENITGRPMRTDELQTVMDYIDLLKFRDAYVFERIYGSESLPQYQQLIDAYYEMFWHAYQNINYLNLISDTFSPEYNFYDLPYSTYELMNIFAEGTMSFRILTPLQKESIELYSSMSQILLSDNLIELKLYLDFAIEDLAQYYSEQGQYILYPCELDQDMSSANIALIHEYRDAKAMQSYELAKQYPNYPISFETYRVIYDMALEIQQSKGIYSTWVFSSQTVDFIPTYRTLTEQEMVAVHLVLDVLSPIRNNMNLDTPNEAYVSILESIRYDFYFIHANFSSQFLTGLLTYDQEALEGLLERTLTQDEIDAINYFRSNCDATLSFEKRIRDFFGDDISPADYLRSQYFLFFQIIGNLDSYSQEDYDTVYSLVQSGLIANEIFLQGITEEYDFFVARYFSNVTEEQDLTKIQLLYQMDWNEYWDDIFPNLLRMQYTPLEYYQTSTYDSLFQVIYDNSPNAMMVFQGIQEGMSVQDISYEGDPDNYDDFVEAYNALSILLYMQRISVIVSKSFVPTQNSILTDWNYMSFVAQYAYENNLSINMLLYEMDLSELTDDANVIEFVTVFRNTVFNANIGYYINEVFSNDNTEIQYTTLDFFVVLNYMKSSGDTSGLELIQGIQSVPSSENMDYVKVSLYETIMSNYFKDFLGYRLNVDSSQFSDSLCIALTTLFATTPTQSAGSLFYNLGNVYYISYWYEQGTFTQAVSNEIEQFIRQLILLNRDGFAADVITDNDYAAIVVTLLNQNQTENGSIDFLFHWDSTHWTLTEDQTHVYEYLRLIRDVDSEVASLVNETYVDGFHGKAIMLLKVYHQMEHGYFLVSEILNQFDSSLEPEVLMCIDEVFETYLVDYYVGRIVSSLSQTLTSDQINILRNYILHVGVEFGGWNYVYNTLNTFVQVNQALVLTDEDKEAVNWILDDLIIDSLSRAIRYSVQNDSGLYFDSTLLIDLETVSAIEDLCWMIIEDDLSFVEIIVVWTPVVGLETLDSSQQIIYDAAQIKLNELHVRVDAVVQAILTSDYQPL